MIPKLFLRYMVVTAVIATCLFPKTAFSQDSIASKQIIKEKLNFPFGTLVKMKIEIVDGEELKDKYHQSSFLFKIKSVDSILLPNPVIIDFRDETGKFPADDFELYKYLYGRKTGGISSSESEKMKKKYVGREFNIVAYETGEFTGIPAGYYKYQPERQDFGFHFRHYVIVVADLTK